MNVAEPDALGDIVPVPPHNRGFQLSRATP